MGSFCIWHVEIVDDDNDLQPVLDYEF